MDKFQVSVLEYLGRLDNGILVLLSIVYNQNYYEATYFYTEEQLILTVQEDLENDLGHKISKDEEYPNLIKDIIKKLVPYNEIFNRLDFVDLGRWGFTEKTEE
jgi:hypothetical protein